MNNISNIRYLVNKKKQPNVFYATENDTSAVFTEVSQNHQILLCLIEKLVGEK